MKFGVILPSFGNGATRLGMVDCLLAAERLGFDSAWLTDHLALPQADAERFGHLFEAVSSLGYLAALTSRIRLGISSLVLPQRNPVEVAKALATLDVLSGGRTLLAVGVGWSEGEFRNLGANFKDRGKRMDEAVQVLRSLWRGGRVVQYSGKYYQFEDLVFSPQPVQAGGPPLWVAGDAPVALKRALRLGDGWHPNARPPEELARALQPYHAMLARRPFTVCLRLRLNFERPEASLHGAPEEVAEQLRAYESAGMNYALIHFEAETHAERERAMRRFAQEVVPALA